MYKAYMKASNCDKKIAEICFVSMATANVISATGRTEKFTVNFLRRFTREFYQS